MSKPLRFSCALLLSACALWAASVDEFKRDCAVFKGAPGLNSFKSCAVDFFTLHPIHPTIKSTVPGGGTGLGLNYTIESPKGEWRRKFTTEGAISFRKFWVAESKFSLIHPAFGASNTAKDSFGATFYVRSRELPLMPFYGLGPKSSESGVVDFSERRTAVGASVLNPLSSWIGVGGVFEGIFPDVGGITSPTTVRSIEKFYSESTAPGLALQPTFLHSEVFLHPHHADPFELDYHIGYHYYRASKGPYSFGRFRAEARHAIFPERSAGQPNRDSMMTIHGLLSMSGSRVPFYMQETLGGSNIDGEPTLRGFRDYRFRDSNLLLFQVQYDRRLWGPLGALVFYDTGKVATRRGDIDFSNMRHSYGAGLSIWVGAKVVFRASVGLGSGEGAHPYFGIPTF